MIKAAIISSVLKGGISVVKKHPIQTLAIILLIVFVGLGYQCGVQKERVRTAEAFEKQAVDIEKKANKIINEKLEENKVLEKDNKEKDRIIAEVTANNVKIEKEMREGAERLKELERKIEIAPPETLLGIVQQALNTNEIWYNANKGVFEFSLVAFRAVASRLSDWEDFTLSREPKYKTQIKNLGIVVGKQGQKIINLTIEIDNLAKALTEKQDSYISLRSSFDDFLKISGKSGCGFWGTVLRLAVGYGSGKLAEAIF